jgi:multidrug efflux pump subunit AcrA (membrane-fusion protein)
VVVGKVVEQPVTLDIEVVGTIEPSLSTTLSAEMEGLTLRFDLREGDSVQQGKTVIAQLKATDRELALAQAEAELTKAREAVRKLKAGLRPEEIDEKRAEVAERKTWMAKYAKDLERSKSMQNRDLVSMAEHDQVESNYQAAVAQYERARKALRVAELGFRVEDVAVAEAEVQRLQAHIQQLREDMRKMTLYAPVSGVITQRYTEVGMWVETGGKVADLVVLNPVLVLVPIPERDISRVRVGDAAEVTLDALPGRTFTGKVKHIIPQADPASRTFPVKIEVPNTPELTFKAGMFARVILRAGAAQPRLFVSKDAVVRRSIGQGVFVVEENKARFVQIKPGNAYEGMLEVAEGKLKAGDLIVVTGNETLQDQAAVVVQGSPRL